MPPAVAFIANLPTDNNGSARSLSSFAAEIMGSIFSSIAMPLSAFLICLPMPPDNREINPASPPAVSALIKRPLLSRCLTPATGS